MSAIRSSSATRFVVVVSWVREPSEADWLLSVWTAFELANALLESQKVMTETSVWTVRSGLMSIWEVRYLAHPLRAATTTVRARIFIQDFDQG